MVANGLELSRRLLDDWALPLIRNAFPHLVDRIAAAATSGSQALGADDDLSRDHGWGPRIDLVLTDSDFRRSGSDLVKVIDAELPKEFGATERRVVWEDRTTDVIVSSIGQILTRYTGAARPPRQPGRWLELQRVESCESSLYFLRHSPVLYDPLGRYTKRKDGFAHYPPDLRLRRISQETWGGLALRRVQLPESYGPAERPDRDPNLPGQFHRRDNEALLPPQR